ncbi:MAG: hypothetical protein EA349_09505 [Halomonadaceae bacterium]|nr:MAG: hypothetical protein EA349_09505 [Halomonadaceae bacterium]
MHVSPATLALIIRAASLSLLLALAGCMGSEGSSSSTPASGTTTQSKLDLSPVVMASEDVFYRNLSQLLDKGSEDIALTVTAADDFIWGTYSQGVLTLETAVVDSLRKSTITLRMANTGEMVSRFDVSVNPPAATAAVAAEAHKLLQQRQDLLALTEPEALYQHLLQLAYWGGEITSEEQQQRLNQWSPGTADSSLVLAESLDQLSVLEESYRTGSGTSGEDLRGALQQTYSALEHHVTYAEQPIKSLYTQAAAVLPETPRLMYRYSPATGTLSALQGSSHSGYWENDQWVFHPWMAYLEIVTNKVHTRACNLS